MGKINRKLKELNAFGILGLLSIGKSDLRFLEARGDAATQRINLPQRVKEAKKV